MMQQEYELQMRPLRMESIVKPESDEEPLRMASIVKPESVKSVEASDLNST